MCLCCVADLGVCRQRAECRERPQGGGTTEATRSVAAKGAERRGQGISAEGGDEEGQRAVATRAEGGEEHL